AGVGIGAVLVLLGGLFFIFKRRGSKNIRAEVQTKSLEEQKAKDLSESKVSAEQHLETQLAEQAAEKARQEAEALMKLKLPAVSTKKTEVLTKHISAEVKKDPALMAQV